MLNYRMRPVHSGEILREDYLIPLGLTANALAKALNVPAPRINDIVREKRGVTADTAMRLARYFGGGPRLCIGNYFAMMEVVLLLATLGQRFKFSLLPDHPVSLLPAMSLRPRDGIKVTVQDR